MPSLRFLKVKKLFLSSNRNDCHFQVLSYEWSLPMLRRHYPKVNFPGDFWFTTTTLWSDGRRSFNFKALLDANQKWVSCFHLLIFYKMHMGDKTENMQKSFKCVYYLIEVIANLPLSREICFGLQTSMFSLPSNWTGHVFLIALLIQVFWKEDISLIGSIMKIKHSNFIVIIYCSLLQNMFGDQIDVCLKCHICLPCQSDNPSIIEIPPQQVINSTCSINQQIYNGSRALNFSNLSQTTALNKATDIFVWLKEKKLKWRTTAPIITLQCKVRACWVM